MEVAFSLAEPENDCLFADLRMRGRLHLYKDLRISSPDARDDSTRASHSEVDAIVVFKRVFSLETRLRSYRIYERDAEVLFGKIFSEAC